MHRGDQPAFRPRCRLSVEQLEDRNMLGDALSWLLGDLFWTDLLSTTPGILDNPAPARRTIVPGVTPLRSSGPTDATPAEEWRTRLGSDRTAGGARLAGSLQRLAPPVLEMEDGARWLDSLIVLPARGNPPTPVLDAEGAGSSTAGVGNTTNDHPATPEHADEHIESVPNHGDQDDHERNDVHHHDGHGHDHHDHDHHDSAPLTPSAERPRLFSPSASWTRSRSLPRSTPGTRRATRTDTTAGIRAGSGDVMTTTRWTDRGPTATIPRPASGAPC